MVGSGLTLIETEKWEDIRKKLYFPDDVDEYANSSKPLVGMGVYVTYALYCYVIAGICRFHFGIFIRSSTPFKEAVERRLYCRCVSVRLTHKFHN